LNPGPADNRFRLSAHCANEPQRQAMKRGEDGKGGEGISANTGFSNFFACLHT